MTTTMSITCDTCENDITYTGNCEEWRLSLKAEPVGPPPGASGAVTAMHVPRPIARDMHFCGIRCLAAWTEPKQAAS